MWATTSPETLTDLELLAELRGVALGIHPQQLLVGDGKLVHQNGRLSAEAGLQDGVMDEDVLLLEGHAVASGHVHGAQTGECVAVSLVTASASLCFNIKFNCVCSRWIFYLFSFSCSTLIFSRLHK